MNGSRTFTEERLKPNKILNINNSLIWFSSESYILVELEFQDVGREENQKTWKKPQSKARTNN